MSKPRSTWYARWIEYYPGKWYVDPGVSSCYNDPKTLRKLAAWLLKAADWLEGREK